VLSFSLAIAGENRPSQSLNGIFQVAASLTLVIQFRTANPHMFIARGLCSWARLLIGIHQAACGGNTWPGEECVTAAWSDVRTPFRVIACVGALRMFANGLSLMLQYRFPRRGVGQHGNEQLFYRGYVQACGLPIHYITAMLKLGELSDTKFQRGTFELVVHFLRAFVIVPIACWSLFDQWVSTGAGKKTDDIRTSNQGEAHPNAADNLVAKMSPHKGHRNLLIRSCTAFAQATVTAWLVGYDISRPPQSLYIISQLVGSMSLFVQWRTGNPKMFIVRGLSNWFACMVAIYHTKCGATWPSDPCADGPWEDERISLRILSTFATIRLFLNGLSLMCQYRFPHRMFRGHGNEQLFYRGCVQASGIPIHICRFFVKTVQLDGNHVPLDYTSNFLRGCLIIPIASWSLFHQWYNTSKGNTGHPASDLYERDMDPTIEDPEERLKVTLISAKGLRRADITGASDPYCICTVHGRPESTFQTKVIPKTLTPEWNESQELPIYRHLDSLELVVRDHDEGSKIPCCKFFDDGDDLLGKAIITSDQIHPSGFCGEVHLTHAGKRHKNASVSVKIEVLGRKTEEELGIAGEIAKDLDTVMDEVSKGVHETTKGVEEVVEEAGEAIEKIVTTAASAAEQVAIDMENSLWKKRMADVAPVAVEIDMEEFKASI
jgi:hypothetical protein